MTDATKKDEATTNDEATTDQTQPEFAVQRIFIKDFSLEVPKSPQIFLQAWDPQLDINLVIDTNTLETDLKEVVLTVTATVKLKDDIAFLAEIKQAGIFLMKHFPEDQVKPMLSIFCPNVLYPYASEAISSAVSKAGFPQLYLSPVNFEALYQQRQQEQTDGDDTVN